MRGAQNVAALQDVLEYFKETGKRYQSRINAVLRQYVEANRKTGEENGGL